MGTDGQLSRRRPTAEEVYTKDLTGIEQAVILAMLKIGDMLAEEPGAVFSMSIPTIAAFSKFEERAVQRAIWGDHRKHPDKPKPKRKKGERDKECPYCTDCLINRRVVQQAATAIWQKNRPAKYYLNLEILDDSKEVRLYLDQQKLRFAPESSTVSRSYHPPSDPRSLGVRSTVARASDPRSLGGAQFDTSFNSNILNSLSDTQRPTVASPSDPRSHDVSQNQKQLQQQHPSSSTGLDLTAIAKVFSKFCPRSDQSALDRIIEGVLEQRADASTEEILHFLAVKGAYASSSEGIKNPAGFLIAAVPECFAGEVFEMWRANLRADVAVAVKAAAADVEFQESIIGKCLNCSRPRLNTSSWAEYCSDSCRDEHKQKLAKGKASGR